ncbi:MAG: VirE protein, partial [Prevotella sp.]|nr:VirE protein [Prevotella sp.]
FALAQKLKEENAEFARLSQSRTYENLSYRANVIAYLKAMILYVANGYKWEKSFETFIRWSEQYDLWCKMHFFAEAIEKAEGEVQVSKRGPRNLLEELPDKFTYDDAVNVRRKQNLSAKKTMWMLYAWKKRGYITKDKLCNDTWIKVKKKN